MTPSPAARPRRPRARVSQRPWAVSPALPSAEVGRAHLPRSCRPFAPQPLQLLPRYYERLRPWLARRYSHLWGLPLVSFPSHRELRFSRSLAKPVSRSCRLYTGCRLRSTQVSRRLIPEIRSAPGFDNVWLFRYVLSGSLTLISLKLT